MRAKKMWIQDMHMKKDSLHKELGVPSGQKIPAKKIKAAIHSKDALVRKRAALAKTLKSFHHG